MIMPREAERAVHLADPSQPVPSQMTPFLRPIQTPLNPLGSKLMSVWRYCDFGWLATDVTKYNVDVEGLHWSPFSAQVSSDYFEQFEIRLAHSFKLPDEYADSGGVVHAFSGLYSDSSPFARNILEDPLGPAPQVVVHDRQFGYRIEQIDMWFLDPSSTPLMPWPFNHRDDPAAPYLTYTWRDTAVLAVGGERGAGMPLAVEARPPLSLYGPKSPGFMYSVGRVPTIGLPLLMEFRCYPTSLGIGVNGFNASLANGALPTPNFRCYSSGGYDTSYQPVIKNPDDEDSPSGGFNPGSRPPGRPTRRVAENLFYFGAIETVIRVSRACSVWIEPEGGSPDYYAPIVEPDPALQPAGTEVLFEYRGATGHTGDPNELFRLKSADFLDAYGDVRRNSPVKPQFLGDENAWYADIDDVDGCRFLQIRFTFLNNIEPGVELNPELSAIGIAYEK
jgi:hypothetical protein